MGGLVTTPVVMDNVVPLPHVNVKGAKSSFGTLLGHGPGGIPAYSSFYASQSDGIKGNYDNHIEVVKPDQSQNKEGGKRLEEESTSTTTTGTATTTVTTTVTSTITATIYSGAQWQCVEYARRYLLARHGLSFPSVTMAFQILSLSNFTRVEWDDDEKDTNEEVKKNSSSSCGDTLGYQWGKVPIVTTQVGQRCINSSSPPSFSTTTATSFAHRPVEGSIIMWKPWKDYFLTGHVAVVTHCHVLSTTTTDDASGGDDGNTTSKEERDLGRMGCKSQEQLYNSIAQTHFPPRVGNSFLAKYQKGQVKIVEVCLVGVAEQNVSDSPWPGHGEEEGRNYARELILVITEETEDSCRGSTTAAGDSASTPKQSMWVFDQEYPRGSVSGWVTPQPIFEAAQEEQKKR